MTTTARRGSGHGGPTDAAAARTSAWTSAWTPVVVFVVVAAVVWLVTWIAAEALPRDYLYPRAVPIGGGRLVEMWTRWDAGWYREIVRHGYRYYPGVQSSVAFFPTYPLAIAGVAWAFPSVPAAGVAITFASGLGAAVLFHRWCTARMAPAAATTSLLVLLLFPYAWYLVGAVYSDAFFLLVVLAAFVLVERERFWAAGLVGFVASASRPTGVAVAVGMVLLVLERSHRDAPVVLGAGGRVRGFVAELVRRFDPRGLSWRTAPVLLSFGGLATWMTYLGVRFGDPLLFLHIEGMWHQGAGPSTWAKVAWFRELPNVPRSVFAASLVLHGVIAVAALLAVPRVARRFGWAYAGFVLITVGIPVIGTKDFMSTGRYVLAAFPLFALVGAALAERAAAGRPLPRLVWLAGSGALLLAGSVGWAMGKYLS